jgi:hypothetical protein
VSLDAGPVKSLRIRFKALESRDKKSRIPACFTFCLPGRPKVNAGGACGAGLAEARCLADFRFDHRPGKLASVIGSAIPARLLRDAIF